MTMFVSIAGFAVLQAADEPEEQEESRIDSAPFVAQIDDSLSVELLAVMPHKSDASQAWQADGTPFETAPDLPKVGFNSATKKLSGVNLFVRYVGLADNQRPTYDMPGVNTMWFPNEDGIASIIVVPDENVSEDKLTIGIPDADWGPWRKLDGNAELIEPVLIQPRYREAYDAIQFHSIVKRGERVMIRWAHERGQNDLAKTELIAVDQQGLRHRPYGTTLWDDPAGVTRDADIFDLALGDIDHFEYRLRPIRYRVTFPHVALRPQQKTKVTSQILTVPIAATDSNKATFNGTIVMPDGSPATSKGYLHYQSRSGSGSYHGTVGEFKDSFRLEGPAGQCYLTYFADEFAPIRSEKFDVEPGDMVEGIVLRLAAGITAEIQVQSKDGSPIEGASVVRVPVIYGSPGGPIYPHKTDVAGRIRLPHFADVPYEFRVEAAGYKKLRTDPININPDKPIVLTLQPADTPTAAVRNADKPYLSLAPPADADAQALAVRVHEQLTAVTKLPSAQISTQTYTSYYGAPQGVIGLKEERSLENLQAALSHRDFEKSLSTANQTWAWEDNVVVATERQKYVYEGEPYDQTSERSWDGSRGWWRDSSGSFGRYRRFADAFAIHYFRPTKYLHLGDHRFGWVEPSDLPSFFVNSKIPVEYANYQKLPDEDFAGERCHVIRSIPRGEQFWISQSTGRLRACLTFASQGKFTWMHEMEATRKLAGRTFESREAFDQWSQENLTDIQRVQLHCEFQYLHEANQHPRALSEFTDYREVTSGIELPMTEWWSNWQHEGKQFKYQINQTIVRDVSLTPDLEPLIEKSLPKKGDKVTDWRFSTPVVYSFDPEMPESEIHGLVDAAQKKQLESAQLVANALEPLKQMLGKPAPKLDGQWITDKKLPKNSQGKPILLHFWATWCGPCKNDIPQLNRMAENGWHIVGVHVPGTEAEEIEKAIADSGMEYPVLRGTETQGAGYTLDRITGYPVKMFPCCVLINKDGKVQAVGSLQDVLAENR
ncbi:redoxin domain-containing protein [Roseimaritima ulvae]|nr:redoxin domain-containing protein [Roseimaritima ulvae]